MKNVVHSKVCRLAQSKFGVIKQSLEVEVRGNRPWCLWSLDDLVKEQQSLRGLGERTQFVFCLL